ncbi:MAG: ThuA domain-containing protein [Candidatus Sumerlaeia bacterium]
MKKAIMSWGGWKGHEPEQCTNKVAEMLRGEDYEVEVFDTLDVFKDADKTMSADVLIPCWTMSEIDKEQCEGLMNAVKEGVGLAGWHGGMGDSFRTNCNFQFMVGGQFVSHPGGIKDYTVNITKSDDPIVQGLSDFDMKSEQYFMHVDPSNEVLATTTFHVDDMPWIDGTVMPVMWKRMWGKGKVFYSSLGHVATDFDVPEVMETMKRGIIWATR